MNFRQIQLLNDLERKVAELETELSVFRNLTNDALISHQGRFQKLENPPKRKPGRPRKVVDDYKVLDSLKLGSR